MKVPRGFESHPLRRQARVTPALSGPGGFRGEFRRLTAIDYLLDDVRSQERETNYPAHVTFAQPSLITATGKSLILVIIAGVAGILSATSVCIPSSHRHWYSVGLSNNFRDPRMSVVILAFSGVSLTRETVGPRGLDALGKKRSHS
jgi:hypothetical protein